MAEREDKEIPPRGASRAARLRNELETLRQLRRRLERELQAGMQGEAGGETALRRALQQVREKIDKVESELGSPD